MSVWQSIRGPITIVEEDDGTFLFEVLWEGHLIVIPMTTAQLENVAFDAMASARRAQYGSVPAGEPLNENES